MGTAYFTIAQVKEWRLKLTLEEEQKATNFAHRNSLLLNHPHPSPLHDTVWKEEGIFSQRISLKRSWLHFHTVLQNPEKSHQHWTSHFILPAPSRSSSPCVIQQISADQFQAMPKKGLTNDCRFQCIVSLLAYTRALFFIHLLLISMYVRLRNTGAGNRNGDTLISLLHSLAPCGENLFPVCEFFIFLQILYLNPQ